MRARSLRSANGYSTSSSPLERRRETRAALPREPSRPGAVMTFHRSRSHWFEQGTAYEPSSPLEGERRTDVCTIGGGMTGLSTAYHLRTLDAGVDVALLESEVIGFGSSG